jgi:photosystem II stability/assembly factor-like uncharacterized protein/pimeloyl-ACP methyl ester carboxylesterase
MRVDKPGVGDSEGPPCSEIDLQTELEGYKAALQQLAAMPGVDPERIYLFGHSMGGVLAPYLTAAVPVRGSMVYGTLARTWFEYQLENVRRQAAFQPGATEAEITEAVQAEAKSSSMILVDKKTLGDVWKRWPELEQPTQGTMLDATHMSTRSMAFFHQLQDLNIARAWQDSRGAVLAIWGEYDWVTSQADHQKIVDIVNKRTPGAATLLVMPKADHAFTTHDTMNESVRAMGRGEWDATLPPKMLAWMASVEGRQYTPPEEPKAPVADAPPDLPAWKKLATEAYPGKQDDIFFVNDKVGWYGNGVGKVFRTIDGGNTWTKQWEHKGTFVRCLAFVDEKVGVLGNIGPGYFPGVTDPVPVYRTEDGGNTWTPITAIEGAPVVGLCAFDIVQVPFINAGKLDKRPRIIGVGRVGGPVAYIWSDDLGKTWKQGKVPDIGAMAFDVKFLDEKRGFIASATNADVSSANALILATEDGGATWEEVYRSERPFETTWKFSFPTDQVGYCTVQSYNPDPEASVRYVAKTLDGGKTWDELRLVDDPAVRAFGIAFVDADTGWVGATPHGFATVDGGVTWHDVNFGNAVNKIRLIRTAEGVTGYAIGVDVHTMHMPANDRKQAAQPADMTKETAQRAMELRQQAMEAIGAKAFDKVRPLVDELVRIDPVADAYAMAAAIDVAQGRTNEAFGALDNAVRLGADDPVLALADDLRDGDDWKSLRADPRFAPLLARAQAGRWKAQPLQFAAATGETPVPSRYSTKDNAYLAALRTKYNLDAIIAGCRGDMERVKMICAWVHTRWSHVGDANSQPHDPMGLLDAAAKGDNFRCVEYGITVAGCLNAVGIPARVVGARSADVETRPFGAGHVFAEAWLADRKKWMFVDAQMNIVGESGSGEPLNALEFRDALVGPQPAFLYPDGLAMCMHYFDYSNDERYPIDARAKGSVTLGPVGAAEPKVFQRIWSNQSERYTHDPAVVYAPPATPE